jgi:hypothetical protein
VPTRLLTKYALTSAVSIKFLKSFGKSRIGWMLPVMLNLIRRELRQFSRQLMGFLKNLFDAAADQCYDALALHQARLFD